MRIAVIGADGQLGSDLVKALSGEDVVPLLHSQIEVADREQCLRVLTEAAPEFIINTAAFHKVDECESNPVKSFQVNMAGAFNAACAALECGAGYVFISTDYVFSGEKGGPYGEDDPPDPVNVYGASKVAGESAVRHVCPRHFIVRTSGLYGLSVSKKGWNFPDRMLSLARERGRLRVVDDQRLTPTFTPDLAAKIVQLMGTGRYGTYHVTSGGSCSWYQFTARILELSGVRAELSPTTSAEFPTPARRPPNSVLRHGRLMELGLDDLRSWEDALAEYLRMKGELK
jgi:dTDP-4-dehydrorhamnose reductase